jgi:hypothetical protein
MQTITQEAWMDAVIGAWKAKHSLGRALAVAACVGKDEKITNDQWNDLILQVGKLKPFVAEHTSLKQPIAAWIAKNYSKASDALWADKYDLARQRLMLSRTKVAMAGKIVKAEIKAEEKDLKGLLIINNLRERDHRTNWHKVK